MHLHIGLPFSPYADSIVGMPTIVFPQCKTYDKPSWNFDCDVRILAGNS